MSLLPPPRKGMIRALLVDVFAAGAFAAGLVGLLMVDG
jgi:hypothetical protein